MLLVIMTRSLIRLGNTVRASLNTGLNGHDEDDARTDVNDDDITKSYRRERERAETNTNNDDITRGYN